MRPRPAASLTVALLGAECTGKSSLTERLGARLCDLQLATVGEYLREWCLRAGRTPGSEDQAHIAAEQASRIDAAARAHALVLADTTPLMTALYSELYFQDRRGLPDALALQRRYALTLVCSPKGLAWQADGWMRESPAVRLQVHERLHRLLRSHGFPFVVLRGPLHARVDQAEALIRRLPLKRVQAPMAALRCPDNLPLPRR